MAKIPVGVYMETQQHGFVTTCPRPTAKTANSPSGIYRSFSECTRGALQHAVTELGLTLSSTDESDLMRAYNSLHTFPEVAGALERAAENDMVDVYIFSNGTDDMIRASVTTSPDLKPHAGLFKDMISVEEVQVFKPTRNSYTHLRKRVGKEEGADDLWLVSANPFDVIGAKAAGLRVAWIDRAGKGWADRLGDVIGGLKPDIIANGVDKAVLEIMDASRK